MPPAARSLLLAAVVVVLASRPGVGRAAADGAPDVPAALEPEQESADDPKVARRLGPRIRWQTAPAAMGSEPPPSATAFARAAAGAASPSLSRASPRLKLAFRRFEFIQLGASDSPAGVAASEPFNSVAVDVYPLTTLVRIGLSTQYGWQGGAFATKGDYFATQSLSIGAQLRGRWYVPFIEGFGGIGYMRRLQFERTVPTVFWQLGVDLGAELYFSRVGYFSVAIGYLRPVNGFAKVQQFTTVYADTWSFKLGVGI